jgi:predicted ATP-binding protein involved in virulence
MNVTRLQVANLRAFEQAEFEFNPHMTLLVGINGVGKTTVLDALRVCLSKTLPEITASRSRPQPFAVTDLRGNAPAMTVQLTFELAGKEFDFVVHKQRTATVANEKGEVRKQTRETPDKVTCTPSLNLQGRDIRSANAQPLGIFFSVRRSLVSDAAPNAASAVGDQAAAFADALSSSRELRLAEIAHWMRAQQQLAIEHPPALRHLTALRRAVKTFVPEYTNLYPKMEPKPTLLVHKGSLVLDVRQLSEGERGVLALVLDLARRLSQANPGVADPVKHGEAVVLIDEVDLHLHPRWQRTIVERLTQTFPHCQFIATTHSPQIVAAAQPEQVLLLTGTQVVKPERTLGMDSNWILRHLMETDDRPTPAFQAIREVEGAINKGHYKKARKIIAQARKSRLDLADWSVLEARIARLEVVGR